MNHPKTAALLRGAGLVAVALASLTSESQASAPCLNPDPKTCKIPEDCMFKRQIAMKRAFRDAFASSAMRCKAMAAARKALGASASPEAVSEKAGDLLYKDIAEHPERVAKTLPKCKSSLKDPPGWTTAEDCTYQAKDAAGKPLSDPDSVDTCSEFLSASRLHEHTHVVNCKAEKNGTPVNLGEVSSWVPHGKDCDGALYNQGVPKAPNRKNMNDFADEEADAYTLEIWDLEDRRAAAIHRCTTARDAAEAAANVSKNAKALGQMSAGAR